MVITLRLDEAYLNIFNEIKRKLSNDTEKVSITPSNSQILKAALIQLAEYLNIDVYKCGEI